MLASSGLLPDVALLLGIAAAAAARFLDRCDPNAAGGSCQDELLQAWLQHPLLDHLATQPQAMLTLLHRLHQAAPAAAATASLAPAAAAAAAAAAVTASLAAAGSVGQGSGGDDAAGAAGGLSPGALLLALLLKMGESAVINHWCQLQLLLL
jgi:hypothetical protein